MPTPGELGKRTKRENSNFLSLLNPRISAVSHNGCHSHLLARLLQKRPVFGFRKTNAWWGSRKDLPLPLAIRQENLLLQYRIEEQTPCPRDGRKTELTKDSIRVVHRPNFVSLFHFKVQAFQYRQYIIPSGIHPRSPPQQERPTMLQLKGIEKQTKGFLGSCVSASMTVTCFKLFACLQDPSTVTSQAPHLLGDVLWNVIVFLAPCRCYHPTLRVRHRAWENKRFQNEKAWNASLSSFPP